MNNIIWESTLDDIFLCKVMRESERIGVLSIKETINGQTIFERKVGLSYGAHFGPDVEDVAKWQELCVNAVDNIVK
jgi:allophanate hydrolase subunit 1